MIKYAGMALILASCAVCGFLFAADIKRRLSQLEAFVKFFDSAIKYVRVYNYPVKKIFEVYRDDGLEFFLERLRADGDGIYVNPWAASLRECKAEGLLFLKDKEYAIVKGFGEQLGVGRADEQAGRLGIYAGELREIYAGEREQGLNHAKLFRWAGVLVGLLICILLI